MMKRCLFVFLLVTLCISGCVSLPDYDDRQVVLIYMTADDVLSEHMKSDYQDLLNAYLPQTKDSDRILLVFRHFKKTPPILTRLSRDPDGKTVETIVHDDYPESFHSATAEALSLVLAQVQAAWPAQKYGLVLSSHGTGFLPKNYILPTVIDTHELDPDWTHDTYSGLVKCFASGDQGISLEELRDVLSCRHFDFIVFDCCLMGTVEVAYELRYCTDYLLFSPAEVLMDGFPYEKMIRPIFSYPAGEAMHTVARDYMAHYRTKSGDNRSATICLVNTSGQGLDKLANACKPIFENHYDQIMTLDRARVQPYCHPKISPFYDIDDFMRQIADENEYKAFSEALDHVVIFKDATEQFLTGKSVPYTMVDIDHYSGLSIYIPQPEDTLLNNYYRTLDWNLATDLVR